MIHYLSGKLLIATQKHDPNYIYGISQINMCCGKLIHVSVSLLMLFPYT